MLWTRAAMLIASPMTAPAGVTSKSPRVDPDPKLHPARRRQHSVAARNIQLQSDSRFHRGARAVEKRHDFVADNLENASIHPFDAVPGYLQAILELAGCREVVLLYQAGIAGYVGGQNRVHPAHVESRKSASSTCRRRQRARTRSATPSASSIISPLRRGRGSVTGAPFTKVDSLD